MGARTINFFELYPEVEDKSTISRVDLQGLSKSAFPLAVFDSSKTDKVRGDRGRKCSIYETPTIYITKYVYLHAICIT